MRVKTKRNLRFLLCFLTTAAIILALSLGIYILCRQLGPWRLYYWAFTAVLGLWVAVASSPGAVKVGYFLLLILLPYVGPAAVLYCLGVGALFSGKRKKVGLYVDYRPIFGKAEGKITYFADGKTYFEDLLSCLSRAQSEVYIYTYIFKHDEATCRLLSTLFDLCDRGVRVSLFADYYGSGAFYKEEMVRALKQRGARVGCYKRPRLILVPGDNKRCHGKVILIDKKTAYLPSMNMCRKEIFFDKNSAVKITGSLDGYLKEFAPLFKIKTEKTQSACTATIPLLCDGSAEGVFLGAIGAAREEIRIVTPYLSLSSAVKKQLAAAVKRGVILTAVIPEIKNGGAVGAVNYLWAEEILALGGRVYLYDKGFLHQKALLCDDGIAVVGSANLDERSSRFAVETVLISGDNRLIGPLLEDFEAIKEKSVPLEGSLAAPGRKLKNRVLRLISPLY